jgi:hypothetical protein
MRELEEQNEGLKIPGPERGVTVRFRPRALSIIYLAFLAPYRGVPPCRGRVQNNVSVAEATPFAFVTASVHGARTQTVLHVIEEALLLPPG